MPPGIEKDICKMNIDLWMHQNTLMWTRLKTLWFVQFGLLALAGYLSVPHPAQPNTPTPIEALNLVRNPADVGTRLRFMSVCDYRINRYAMLTHAGKRLRH